MRTLKLTLAGAVTAVALTGCFYAAPAPEATGAAPPAPRPNTSAPEPAPADPEAEFYADMVTAYPDEMTDSDVRTTSLAMGHATCDVLDAGGTMDQIMANVDQTFLAFQTTVVYFGVIDLCPEYTDVLNEWMNK